MAIDNGVDKLTAAHKKSVLSAPDIARQWRDIKNKIDSILKSNHRKTDELKNLCVQLDDKSHEERCKFITENWGIQYLNKVSPLLQQLTSLESRNQ